MVYVDNYYIIGIHSTTSANDNKFNIYLFLSNDYDSDSDLLELLQVQLKSMDSAGYPTSTSGLEHLMIVAISNTPPNYELDDEPIHNTTNFLPASLTEHPYKYNLTLPTNSPASYGLLFFASRQVKWTASIPETSIPTYFPVDIRRSLLHQIPTIIRINTIPP